MQFLGHHPSFLVVSESATPHFSSWPFRTCRLLLPVSTVRAARLRMPELLDPPVLGVVHVVVLWFPIGSGGRRPAVAPVAWPSWPSPPAPLPWGPPLAVPGLAWEAQTPALSKLGCGWPFWRAPAPWPGPSGGPPLDWLTACLGLAVASALSLPSSLPSPPVPAPGPSGPPAWPRPSKGRASLLAALARLAGRLEIPGIPGRWAPPYLGSWGSQKPGNSRHS